MASFNQCILVGNLTADPALTYSGSGTPICNFTVAANHKYGDKEDTLFMRCVAFKALAEIVAKYATKGKSVLVAGRLQENKWTDDNNVERRSVELIVNDFQFLGSVTKPSTLEDF